MIRHLIERRRGEEMQSFGRIAARGRVDLQLAVLEIHEARFRGIDFEVRRSRRWRPSRSFPHCEIRLALSMFSIRGQPSW